MSNKHKSVLKGEKALVVRVLDSKCCSVDIEGQAVLDGLDVTGDLVVSDEFHCHAQCRHVLEAAPATRRFLSQADTGSMLRVAQRCEIILPPITSSATPLRFEILATDTTLLRICAPVPFASTSYVVVHNEAGATPWFPADEIALFDTPVQLAQLFLTTIPGHKSQYCLRGDVYA